MSDLSSLQEKKNKLKLDTNKDALGMRKINMFWDNLSDIEKDTVVKSVKTMARELGVLGTGKIRFKELLNGESYKFEDSINHHIGTTRMSDSPKTELLTKIVKSLDYLTSTLPVVQFLLLHQL